MTLSTDTAWEVRTTGNATNGGGFVAGASGTDWSQQDAAQYSVTDGVGAGTTNVVSATANFGTDVVGNICYFDGAWYQITARTNATTIVVDRNTTTGTGLTLKIGGALSSLANLAANMAVSNKAFIKSGTYQTNATLTFAAPQAVVTNATMPNRLIGYKTTRGDIKQSAPGVWDNNASRPIIQLITNTSLTAILTSNGGWVIENLSVDCATLGSSIGMQLGGNPSVIRNCKVANFTSMGVFMAAPGQGIYDCEVTGGTSSASRAVLINDVGQCIVRCNIHDNVCIGVLIAGTSAGCVRNCLITNNTGAGNAGIKIDNNYYGAVHNNVIWGSGGNGISIGTRWWGAIEIRGNILGNNGGYNIEEIDGAGSPAGPWWDGNAYFTSTSGNRNNLDDTTTNPINGVSPYTNVLDVALSGDPFTNSAGGDFTLNNTTGAGAACRAVGFPGAMPGVSQVGYMDFGIFQHQDSGGGGGGGASSIGLGSPGIRAAN